VISSFIYIRTQTLRRRSWKWWFWHYNGFNVKRLLCKSVLLFMQPRSNLF